MSLYQAITNVLGLESLSLYQAVSAVLGLESLSLYQAVSAVLGLESLSQYQAVSAVLGLESLSLYQAVTAVFDRSRIPGWAYYLIGYGLPCAIGMSSESSFLSSNLFILVLVIHLILGIA